VYNDILQRRAAMHLSLVRFATISLLAATMAACGTDGPIVPIPDDLNSQRAAWAAQNLTDYSYDYAETGYFICCTEGQEVTLGVRNDTVVSAVFTATGQPVTVAHTRFPTIDELFDRAEQALRNRALKGIAFDPRLHYPMRIDFDGPPDASGSVFAVRLRN